MTRVAVSTAPNDTTYTNELADLEVLHVCSDSRHTPQYLVSRDKREEGLAKVALNTV